MTGEGGGGGGQLTACEHTLVSNVGSDTCQVAPRHALQAYSAVLPSIAWCRAIVGRALRLLWDHLSAQPFSAVLDVPIPVPRSLPPSLIHHNHPHQGQPQPHGLQVLGLMVGPPSGPPPLVSVASDAHLTPEASQSVRSTLPQYRRPGVQDKA
jgi:hypothetical protein